MENSTLVRPLVSSEEFLDYWQGHRRLTRRVIEAFPEKELFEFSVGGMRPFAELVKELLAIASPGLKEIVSGQSNPFHDKFEGINTKAQLLDLWDKSTEEINQYWKQIPADKFHQNNNLFGQYDFPVIQNLFYFVDNEIHHRGQGYVYLRALGIEPPYFWER
ncbi:damage-inducible protein DinB [Pseudoxanthomonas sp. SGD-10]|nr:damage-inducible protein DinB [Pseudoxanthomonas sp. SGD-10]